MGNKITRRCSTVDERYTRPQGLYPQRDVDQKKLRRLILNSKLAPCFPGEDETNADFEECPICFLYYPSLNRSKCCSKGVCTECFLQMKSPRAARSTQCPFCKSHNYAVEYRGVKTVEEKGIEAAEEQKVIEAKIRMRKQELLDDEEREQRSKEENVRESGNTPISETPQQVKPTPDIEKWKQNLCEPSYCYDQQWLCKPCGPSLTAGPSSFRTCGSHCEPNCSKCLMTFHKRRVYDVLDVITPPSGALKENRIEPFVGRWRSTWGHHNSPLSRSFPLPSRLPEYHCRHTRILEPEALGQPSLDVPLHPDGLYVCVDHKANNLAQELVASGGMSDRPGSCDDLGSSWVCEGSLAPTPAPQQSIAPLPPPSSQPRSSMESQHQPGLAPPGYARHRDDEFDFDLEDIMVMEAIWQSIQEQGARHRETVSETIEMGPNQLSDVVSESRVDAGTAAMPPAPQPPATGLEARGQHPHGRGIMAEGLASAIAALAEQHAIKGEASIAASQQTSNRAESFPSELQPAHIEVTGELGHQQPHEILLDVEAEDCGFVRENLFSARCDKSEEVAQNNGESGLYAMAMTLATGSGSGKFLGSSSEGSSCSDDESSQQVEVGTNISGCGHAYEKELSCAAPVNSPVVRINRCATDTNGKVDTTNCQSILTW